MKYFSPSYWFKLWVLSAPLFNDKTQGINAKSIDNKKIKDWASNNTNLQSINQEISYTNSSNNYQSYNLNETINQNINPFYQSEFETSTHKHRNKKSRSKRDENPNLEIKKISVSDYLEFNNKYFEKIKLIDNSDIILINVDNQNNTYFGTDNGLYVLKSNETVATKINEINNINSINFDNNDNVYFLSRDGNVYFLKQGETEAKLIETYHKIDQIKFDSNDNIYFGTNTGAYVLKNGETEAKLIETNETIHQIQFDNNNNTYFGTDNGLYVLKSNETVATKINEINNINSINFDNNDNAYFGTYNGLYVLKSNETVATKIKDTDLGVENIYISKNNNVYLTLFSSGNFWRIFKFCVLKSGEKNLRIIEGEYNDPYGAYKTNLIIDDNNNNLYFTVNDNKVYVLKDGDEKSIQLKIDTKDKISQIFLDNLNNFYIETNNGLYVLKSNETVATKIVNKFIKYFQTKNNINNYFSFKKYIYILKNNNFISTKIKIRNLHTDIYRIEIDSKNNVYFLSSDGNVYFLKQGETEAKLIETNETIHQIQFDKQNNVYFLSRDGNVYFLKQGETTVRKIEGINHKITSLLSEKNGDIYFISGPPIEFVRPVFSALYVLKANEKIVTKIESINENIEKIIIDNKNNIYYVWKKWICKACEILNISVLKSGETTTSRITENNDNIFASYDEKKNEYIDLFIDKNDNVYFLSSDGNVYFLKQGETEARKIETYERINQIQFDKKDNAYFLSRDGNVSFLKQGETTATKINEINNINSINFDNNDNVYFLSRDGNVYFLNQGETEARKINEINNINSFAINSKNEVIINCNNETFLIKNKILLKNLIKSTNLKNINNNDDETILNTLNFLNRESNYFVNLNKMQVFNKTTTSAIVEAIKGKYRGQITVNYKIKNQNEISNIDLNDLLKKVIYFDFINKNFYSFDKIKDIKDINIENLNFWNIEITRDSKLLYSVDFKNACPKREKINKSSITKILKIPKCEYNSTSKISFQITKGLTKTNLQNNLSNWNINIEDEIKLDDFIKINNKETEIINELSDKFDISNINKQEQVTILDTFNEDEDELQIAPKERVEFKYSVREINLETSLNLKQKITGTFSAKIINDENQEETIILSPKEAMQTLQKYSLLPNEFAINEDNSITFNGKAKISLTQEAKPQKIENYFSI